MFSGLQLREVFHFCFLERLLKMADTNLFVLKGGVNLRFFFHSPRYSEDMDLDVLGGAVATLRKNGYKLLNDAAFRRTLRTYGIADIEVNDPARAKHTQTTQRFRVRLVTAGGERLPSKVEFSRRMLSGDGRAEAGDEEKVVDQIDAEIARHYNRLSFRCQHYSGEAAVLQKVLALAGRPVTQARDVFDLDILKRGGFTRGVQLQHSVGRRECSAALQNLDVLSFDDFAGQVVEFLEEQQRREYGNPAAWDAMVNQVRGLLRAP
ncbi:MAG: nucleotidyl transferase AbiEii/AbiGii toxin family protein [Woeseia sp.]